jgi:hypothetical protein
MRRLESGRGISMSYARANTKLSEAIEALATSAQHTIQQRLAIAYMFHLRSVEPDELPPEVESQFKELKDKLTRIPGQDRTGAIVATTNAMSLQDAVEIAKELVRISHIVAAEHHRVELLEQPSVVRRY